MGASNSLAPWVTQQTSAQRAVGDYLHAKFAPNSNATIFSDEGTATVMSGVPEEKFLTSSDAPRDRAGFLAFLKAKHVEYLVFVNRLIQPGETVSGVEEWNNQ